MSGGKHTAERWFVRDLRASTMAALGWSGPSIDTILIVNKTGSEIVESAGENCVVARIDFENRAEALGGANMADALLIAAAPELLDVAIQARSVLRTVRAETTDATALRVLATKIARLDVAIANATGVPQ